MAKNSYKPGIQNMHVLSADMTCCAQVRAMNYVIDSGMVREMVFTVQYATCTCKQGFALSTVVTSELQRAPHAHACSCLPSCLRRSTGAPVSGQRSRLPRPGRWQSGWTSLARQWCGVISIGPALLCYRLLCLPMCGESAFRQ